MNPPLSSDDAVFNLGSSSPYTVNINSSQTANDLVVQTDSPDFSFSSSSTTLGLGGQIDVGDSSAQNGTLGLGSASNSGAAQVTSGDGWYIGASGGTGVLNTTNLNATIENSSGIFVGDGGGSNGTLDATEDVIAAVINSSTGELLIGGVPGTSGSGGVGNVTISGISLEPFGDNPYNTFGGGVYVGRNGTGTLSLNDRVSIMAGGTNVADVVIGDLATGNGTVTVSDSLLSASGYLSVGAGERTGETTAGGIGVLNVGGQSSFGDPGGSAGATLGVIIGASGGNGTANLSGGSLSSTNGITIGDDGIGAVNISSHGSLGADDLYVGGDGGTGTLQVNTGTVNIRNNMVIGADAAGLAGTGAVQINSAGRVDNSAVLFVTAAITVESGGSLQSNDYSNVEFNILNLSSATPGSVNLDGGIQLYGNNAEVIASNFAISTTADLESDGTFTGNLTNNGSISNAELTIDGNFTQSSSGELNPEDSNTFIIDGNATFAGTLNLLNTLPDDPYPEEQFKILSFGSETGQFSNIYLPPLPSGESWSTADLYTTGTIVAVPEPASLLAFGATLFLLSRRSRLGQPVES